MKKYSVHLDGYGTMHVLSPNGVAGVVKSIREKWPTTGFKINGKTYKAKNLQRVQE